MSRRSTSLACHAVKLRIPSVDIPRVLIISHSPKGCVSTTFTPMGSPERGGPLCARHDTDELRPTYFPFSPRYIPEVIFFVSSSGILVLVRDKERKVHVL